ncbi:hypothetical protein GE115_07030 [Agromyces sp. CFH 90414]|uniref:ABM domain-containing protein n=1 Tax=Agromyces agglutinans TaxID=2662258 RepID=A0A6I2F5K0_9MICO|nr:hypothetical protein [Agromyces agglutinans]MRG59624.1 hypothetical protein [Agromyces agglutinans]
MIVELTRFRAADAEALLAARPAMVAEFAEDRSGFLGARLVRLVGDEWLDIVDWESADDLTASRAKGANLSGIAAFFAAIDSLVASEDGEDVSSSGR